MRARDAFVTVDYGNTNVVARALTQLDILLDESRSRDSYRIDPGFSNSNNNSAGSSGHYSGVNSQMGVSGNNSGNNNRISPPSSYRVRVMDVNAAS